jgi:hypothetical protein
MWDRPVPVKGYKLGKVCRILVEDGASDALIRPKQFLNLPMFREARTLLGEQFQFMPSGILIARSDQSLCQVQANTIGLWSTLHRFA